MAAASKASEVSNPADRARSSRAAPGAYAGSVYPASPYAEWTAELRGDEHPRTVDLCNPRERLTQ